MLTLFLQSGLPLPHKSQRHPHPIQAQGSFAFLIRRCHFPSPTSPKRRGSSSDFLRFIRKSGQWGHASGVFPGCDIQRKYSIAPMAMLVLTAARGHRGICVHVRLCSRRVCVITETSLRFIHLRTLSSRLS